MYQALGSNARLVLATLVIVAIVGCGPPGTARAVKPVVEPPPRLTPYPRESMALSASSGATCPLAGDGSVGSENPLSGTMVSLHGSESFEPAELDPEARCWYEELWSVIQDPDSSSRITDLAASNNLYTYSRDLNTHVTALLSAFRVTGDLALLDEVDRLAQHMRAQLDDRWYGAAALEPGSTDGYLNWVWRQSTSEAHRGRDLHEVDEMRTHAMVAMIAWAFAANRDLDGPNGVDYSERADFWTDYLRNHFEAKWRERSGTPWPRFPFLDKPHVHETIDFIRYHHYLHQLTDEEAYAAEAERLTTMILDNFAEVETDAGPALVTPRSIVEEGGSQDYLMPSTYVRYVYASAVDLHFEGVGAWASAELMEKLARSLTEFIMDDGHANFARDMGGGEARAGIPASNEADWSRVTPARFGNSPFALMSPWDATGEVAKTAKAVYDELGSSLNGVFIPVGMLLGSSS